MGPSVMKVGVRLALSVARHHDGQHAHGGLGVLRCLRPIAKVGTGLIQIQFPEHGLTPDRHRPEIVPALGIVVRLECIERTSGLNGFRYEGIAGLDQRLGYNQSALDRLIRSDAQTGKPAEGIVLGGDDGGIRSGIICG